MDKDFVGLNVGGKIFKTTRGTLSRYNSVFPAILFNYLAVKDEQGNYLLDHDGEIFRHILNYLRFGKLVVPDSFDEFTLLEEQANFFQLHGLKKLIKDRPQAR